KAAHEGLRRFEVAERPPWPRARDMPCRRSASPKAQVIAQQQSQRPDEAAEPTVSRDRIRRFRRTPGTKNNVAQCMAMEYELFAVNGELADISEIGGWRTSAAGTAATAR